MPLIAVYKYQPKKRRANAEEIKPGRRRRVSPPVWYLKWRDAAGRQHKKSTQSRDERTAEGARRDQERRLANDVYGGIFPEKFDAKRRWSAVVKDFLSVRTSRPKTLEAYRYCGLAFEREMKDPPILKVDGLMLEQFVAARHKLGKKATTVNKELRHVGAVLAWAAKQGYMRSAPKWREYRCKEDQRKPVVIAEEVFQKVLAALGDPKLQLRRQTPAWWKMFLRLLHWTGCRTGELLGLQHAAVHLDCKKLKVVAESSKSRRERMIPLPNYLVEELESWFRSQKITDRAATVFTWNVGLRQLYDEWKLIREFAKVPPHVLKNYRSSRACVLIAIGESTVTVKDWLGHSSVVTLERYYANAELRLVTAGENLERHLLKENAA